MSIDENTKLIRVFVHLTKGYGAPYWEERWLAGRLTLGARRARLGHDENRRFNSRS